MQVFEYIKKDSIIDFIQLKIRRISILFVEKDQSFKSSIFQRRIDKLKKIVKIHDNGFLSLLSKRIQKFDLAPKPCQSLIMILCLFRAELSQISFFYLNVNVFLEILHDVRRYAAKTIDLECLQLFL